MRWVILAVVVAICWVASLTTSADTPKDAKSTDSLEKRVTELERRVAALETRPKVPPPPALDAKLIGSWAAGNGNGVVGLRFEANGRCRVATADDKGRVRFTYGLYEVAGKAVKLTHGDEDDPKVVRGTVDSFAIVSADEKKLVIRGQLTGEERTFERQ